MNPLLDARPRTDQDPPGSFSAREDKKRAAFGAFLDEDGFLDSCPACGHSLSGQYIFSHIHSVDEDELDTLAILAAFSSDRDVFSQNPFLYELSLLHHGE
jgi:hypothetical protein